MRKGENAQTLLKWLKWPRDQIACSIESLDLSSAVLSGSFLSASPGLMSSVVCHSIAFSESDMHGGARKDYRFVQGLAHGI